MGRPRLDALPGYDPRIIKRRPTDDGTIFGHSRGGIARQPEVLNRPERQNFTQRNMFNPASNDDLIEHDRDYKYRRAYYIQPGQNAGNLSWTAAGPAKDMPTTRFNRNVRPLVGGGHRDMWGQHTDIQTLGQNALAGKPRMRPGKQNQLTVQRYRGQSYSATTKIVGHP